MSFARGTQPPRSGRRVVEAPVAYRAQGARCFATATDVGANGIFVLTADPEPIGTRLQLEFDGVGFVLEGIVAWSVPWKADADAHPGMFVEILNMTQDLLRRFAERIARS